MGQTLIQTEEVTKECSKCKIKKTAKDFHKSVTTFSNPKKKSICIACVRAANKNYKLLKSGKVANDQQIGLLLALYVCLMKPEHWAKEVTARDSFGRQCLPEHASAIKWDLNGALIALSNNHELRSSVIVLLRKSTKDKKLSEFNDSADHKQVCSLVYRTILAI